MNFGNKRNSSYLTFTFSAAIVMCWTIKIIWENFDAKSDSARFLGYCSSSKGYMVYNRRTNAKQETTHVMFV